MGKFQAVFYKWFFFLQKSYTHQYFGRPLGHVKTRRNFRIFSSEYHRKFDDFMELSATRMRFLDGILANCYWIHYSHVSSHNRGISINTIICSREDSLRSHPSRLGGSKVCFHAPARWRACRLVPGLKNMPVPLTRKIRYTNKTAPVQRPFLLAGELASPAAEF